jgi:GxxExxY protein
MQLRFGDVVCADKVRNARAAVVSWFMPGDDRDAETYAIIGAAMRVHRALGAGFLEAVYQEALGLVLDQAGIPWQREVPVRIRFEGHTLRTIYRADLVCFDRVLVEVKALRKLSGAESAQVLNYLKASGLERALLLNFGAASLEYQRYAFTERRGLTGKSADFADYTD